MLEIQGTACCGVGEIHGIQRYRDVKKLVRDFLLEEQDLARNNEHNAFYIFTSVTSHSMGAQLEKFIRRHKLGTLARTAQPRTNPNSGNKIHAWIFGPDWRALARLQKRNDWPAPEPRRQHHTIW